MSEKDFVKKDGLCCPYCGSTDIGGGFVEIEQGCAGQRMSCTDCGERWEARYVLAGYIDTPSAPTPREG